MTDDIVRRAELKGVDIESLVGAELMKDSSFKYALFRECPERVNSEAYYRVARRPEHQSTIQRCREKVLSDLQTEFDRIDAYHAKRLSPDPPQINELSERQILDSFCHRKYSKEKVLNNSSQRPEFDDDPKHPNNLCYQCHRRLPPNALPWNASYPMFDTQKCKDTATRRHISSFDNLRVSDEDMAAYKIAKEQSALQVMFEPYIEWQAFDKLAAEYSRYVADYEHDAIERAAEELLKQQEREERDRVRLQREQERQEERQRREHERLEREAERQAHEDEKARKIAEEEQARRDEEEKWRPRPFKA
jgi:hypothetical protein